MYQEFLQTEPFLLSITESGVNENPKSLASKLLNSHPEVSSESDLSTSKSPKKQPPPKPDNNRQDIDVRTIFFWVEGDGTPAQLESLLCFQNSVTDMRICNRVVPVKDTPPKTSILTTKVMKVRSQLFLECDFQVPAVSKSSGGWFQKPAKKMWKTFFRDIEVEWGLTTRGDLGVSWWILKVKFPWCLCGIFLGIAFEVVWENSSSGGSLEPLAIFGGGGGLMWWCWIAAGCQV